MLCPLFQVPSNVAHTAEDDALVHDDSVLGNVHLDLAKYHELRRFTDDGTYDKAAALFHLRCAADCGVIAAATAYARIYLGEKLFQGKT